MSVLSSSALYRLYAQVQTLLATVNNTSGTWSSGTAKYVPHNRISLKRIGPLISAEYKTGTGSKQAGVKGGKAYGQIDRAEVPFMPSGAAGTVPNTDPILQAIFGQAPTVVAATSVTYSFADGAGIPLSLGLFNEATGGGNTTQFLYGGVPKGFSINVGGNGESDLTFDGVGFYCLESQNFANEDTTGKGGLTTFPAEPSPTIVGNIIPSFAQTVTFGGTSVPEFRSMTIKGDTGRTLRMDGVGFYPDTNGVVQGRRSVMLSSLKFADSNGAGLVAVQQAKASKAVLDVIVTQGNVAGSIVTYTVKSVQFADCTINEDGSGGVDLDWDDSPAHASALTSLNELTIALT